MAKFIREMQIRWADLDPNRHLRHSVYYDWCAMCRFEYLDHIGLTDKVMHELQIGPVIFREECIFRKEIRHSDKVTVDFSIIKARRDFSRFTIRHEIIRNGQIAAISNVDLAWLDITQRKLTVLDEATQQLFREDQSLYAEGFEWEEKKV